MQKKVKQQVIQRKNKCERNKNKIGTDWKQSEVEQMSGCANERRKNTNASGAYTVRDPERLQKNIHTPPKQSINFHQTMFESWNQVFACFHAEFAPNPIQEKK